MIAAHIEVKCLATGREKFKSKNDAIMSGILKSISGSLDYKKASLGLCEYCGGWHIIEGVGL